MHKTLNVNDKQQQKTILGSIFVSQEQESEVTVSTDSPELTFFYFHFSDFSCTL